MTTQQKKSAILKNKAYSGKYFYFLRMIFCVLIFLVSSGAAAQHKLPKIGLKVKSSVLRDPTDGDSGGGCGGKTAMPDIAVNQPSCGVINGHVIIKNYDSQAGYVIHYYDNSFKQFYTTYLDLPPGNYKIDASKSGSCTSDMAIFTIFPSATRIFNDLQPGPYILEKNSPAPLLSIGAEGLTVTYRWFKNNQETTIGGTLIQGAVTSSFSPNTTSPGINYYFAVLTGTCGTVISKIAKVTIIDDQVYTGKITTSDIAGCPGANNATLGLTISPAPPVTNFLTYQWESTLDTTQGFTTVGSSSSYNATNLNATNYYRVKITNTDPNNSYINYTPIFAVKVNASTQIIKDSVIGTFNISNGIAPIIGLTKVAGNDLHYQWFYNTINNNQNGTALQNTDFPVGIPDVTTPGTDYYYLTVTGSCGSATSGVAEVIINQIPVAGTIVGAKSVCPGTNNTALWLHNYTGTIQWQSSTDNISFANIPGAIGPNYTASNLSVSTFYRVIATAGATAISESVQIKISPYFIKNLQHGTVQTTENGRAPVFSVNVQGDNLSYQWYRGFSLDFEGSPIAGANDSTYTPDVSNRQDFYRYWVVVNTSCGIIKSDSTLVDIEAAIVPDANGIVYVSYYGGGNRTGSSWANATQFLADAFAANNVKQIWVTSGYFYPSNGGGFMFNDPAASFILRNNVEVYGGFKGDETSISQRDLINSPTVLEGNGISYHVVTGTGTDNTAILDGFIIQGGKGIGSVEPQGRGGGLYNGDNSSPIIKNCIFRSNIANYGGAVYNSFNNAPSFINCLFMNNTGLYLGGGIFNDNTTAASIINCTISGNTNDDIIDLGNLSTVKNSIIWSSYNSILGNPTISNSIVNGGWPGTGNLASDPLFVDAPNWNFHLQFASPAKNKGDNTANNELLDIEGNPRKVVIIDMGAYENIDCPPGTLVYVNGNAIGSNDGSSWGNAFNNLQDALNLNCSPVTQIWVAAGIYKPDSRADNLSNANPNDRYNSFILKNNVKIYGGFAGTETLLSQRDSSRTTNNTILSGDIGDPGDHTDNAYHVVISAGNVGAAALNGFTVQDGNADGVLNVVVNGITVSDNAGSGINITTSNPAINNVTFSGNYGKNGGGIYIENASPELSNLIASNNSVTEYGGGVYNRNSTPILTNLIVSGNNAAISGGGITNFGSSPIITNTLITGNTANWASGLYNVNVSNAVLTNVTISGNSSIVNGSGVYNQSGSNPQIRNSIIYGNKDGIVEENTTSVIFNSLVQGLTQETNGNISGNTNPLFDTPISAGLSTGGDFHLKSTSPVISKGNGAYFDAGSVPDLSAITTDLDGHQRIKKIIELGAYEYNSYVLPVEIVNYTAQVEGNRAKLKWTTHTESNNKEFIISRSADGKNFKEIGRVEGAGNSTTANDYVFYDEHPGSGNNFYRLEQLDFDNYKTDIGVRVVNFSLLTAIRIYPNPVKELLQIEFTAGLFQKLELTDVSGKILKVIEVGALDNHRELNMSNLSAGNYFMRFVGNGKLETRKVIK